MVHFQSQYGYHQGIIERISNDKVIILSPRQYVPTRLTGLDVPTDEVNQFDIALAAWGVYGRGAYGAGVGGYGGGIGRYGWTRWAVSFLAIYVLFGLLW